MAKMLTILSLLSVFAFQQLDAACPSGWTPSSLAGGKCYLTVSGDSTQLNWLDASANCQQRYPQQRTQLVSITSSFESTEVQTAINQDPNQSRCQAYWTGLNSIDSNGQYFWSDGTSLAYNNWCSGQPNSNFHCTATSNNGRCWNTVGCRVSNCFICQGIFPDDFTTTPAPVSYYPCKSYVFVQFDGSTALSQDRFLAMRNFINSRLLSNRWTHFERFSPGVFYRQVMESYLWGYLKTLQDAQNAVQSLDYDPNPTVSIVEIALDFAVFEAEEQIETCSVFGEIPFQTVLFIAANETGDVQQCRQYAARSRGFGNLIIIGVGPLVDQNFLRELATPGKFFYWPDPLQTPNDLADNILNAITCDSRAADWVLPEVKPGARIGQLPKTKRERRADGRIVQV